MQQLTILNTKEIRQLREMLLKQFGYFPKEDYAFLRNENNRVFLINKDVAKLDWQKLIVDKMGLYFGEFPEREFGKEFRLSKEGAQLLGVWAKKDKVKLKNVVTLTAEEVKEYFQGRDLQKDCGTENQFVLLQYQNSIFGCAKYKEGRILNFMPKIHRGEVIL